MMPFIVSFAVAVLLSVPTMYRLVNDVQGYIKGGKIVEEARKSGRTAWATLLDVIPDKRGDSDFSTCYYEFEYEGIKYSIEGRGFGENTVKVCWPEGHPEKAIFEDDAVTSPFVVWISVLGGVIYMAMVLFISCCIAGSLFRSE